MGLVSGAIVGEVPDNEIIFDAAVVEGSPTLEDIINPPDSNELCTSFDFNQLLEKYDTCMINFTNTIWIWAYLLKQKCKEVPKLFKLE